MLDFNSGICTLFEIFIFCPKNQLWFSEKVVNFLGWKTRENVVVLDFWAVDNFDFTRKIVKKKFGWKTRENVGVLSKLNFGQKFETLSFSEEEYFEEYQEAKNWTLDFGKSSMSLVYCGFQQVQQIINCLKSRPAFNIEIVNPIKLYP